MIYLTWIVLAIVIATLGGNKKIGFWPALAISLVLSPIIGLIITVLSPTVEEHYHPPVVQNSDSIKFDQQEETEGQFDAETANG
jgi:tetrahydromethanopterin S-methyltransferase subunit C